MNNSKLDFLFSRALSDYFAQISFYFKRQKREVKEGGFKIISRKITSLLKKTLPIPLVILITPFIILIRALRPIIMIRLIDLDAGRIGALAEVDYYLAFRNEGMWSNRNFDIICFYTSSGGICNQYYVKMLKRILRTFPFGGVIRIIKNVNRLVPGYECHVTPRFHYMPISKEKEALNNKLVKCILNCKKPPITFTSEEEILGEKALQELSVPEGIHFICFHARDSSYLDEIYTKRDWTYHDFRDSSIHDYVPAAEEMVQRSYYAIRMGSAVKEKLTVINPAIIDYAGDGKRTEFLDVYLSARCRFFLCADTGLSNISEIFRRPMVYVNTFFFALLYRLWVRNAIFIFKKYYFSKEQRFLTFREIIQSELLFNGNGKKFQEQGIELIDNTPKEILAATIEMDERLKGIWETNEEDEALQMRFWTLFRPGMLKSPNIHIGAEFLRQNIELLK